MKYFPLVVLLLASNLIWSQKDKNQNSVPANQRDEAFRDSINNLKKSLKQKKPEEEVKLTIKDYRIIPQEGDSTFVDTTLTIAKEYKYNVLRKDDFELMPFANVGQPYNRLGRNFESSSVMPGYGAQAKQFMYIKAEDFKYYHVPTPLTELFFKTTFEQGQYLDALLTFNTSPRLNFSVAYSGFRSLGKYAYEQAESGRFRTGFNYRTKNNRYWVRGHLAVQDLESEENGGLLNKAEQFESGEEDFIDRSRIDLVYTNADSRLLGRRYVLNHQFNLVKPKRDSLVTKKTLLALSHKFQYESKFFQFVQAAANASLGDAFLTSIDDKSKLQLTKNNLSIDFSNPGWGNLSAGFGFYNYNYFFNSILVQPEQTITNRIEGNEMLLEASYDNSLGPIHLKGELKYQLSGDIAGNLLNASIDYDLNDNNKIFFRIHGSSRMPNFNFLLYQSDYENFNWQNTTIFDKQRVQSATAGINSKWLGDISVKYSNIDNYTYFDSNATTEQIEAGQQDAFVKPFQETATINYLRAKWQKEIKWRKWALNNTVLYQNVNQNNQVLNLPEILTRNTLYYSSDVFKKAMYIQTGVTFKYFSAYNMDAYNPLIGDFYIQDSEELGAYPLIDFFINAKVRQTRIYLKAEHLNTLWQKEYNYYAAPNYPYRDFVIRFGLVWNFFS
ncbi:hypothetical protein GCM10011414_00010 [Croceivirga lutea]|uniref:putative porin n=1 Tax=Croceivirga lutea TaxID=1775167 RepID=UPI00163AEC96|nr:putative porin [Croceivirga lutea]GGG34563.1 hypothetical protein GCM10011414_00010 [Croceivirga lutea]